MSKVRWPVFLAVSIAAINAMALAAGFAMLGWFAVRQWGIGGFSGPECVVQPVSVDLVPLTSQNRGALQVVGTLCGSGARLVVALQPLPDGRLAVAGRFASTRIWSLDRPVPDRELATGDALGLAWLDESQQLVVTGDDGSVQRWTLDGEALQHVDAHRGPVWGVTALGGGAYVTAGRDGAVHRWRDAEIVATARDVGDAWSVASSEEEVVVGVMRGFGGALRTFDHDLQRRSDRRYDSPIWSIARYRETWLGGAGARLVELTPDGAGQALVEGTGTQRSVVRASSDSWVSGSWGGAVHVFDAPTNHVYLYANESGRVQAVAVARDGTWIAAGGDGGIVRIWGVPQ